MIPRRSELLVIRRSKWVRAPGAFCFPGGGIEPGEHPQEALVREVREELGVESTAVRPLWSSITPWDVPLVWWLAKVDVEADMNPDPAEVASFHWLTREQLLQWDGLLESNVAFLRAWQQGEFEIPLDAGT